jgi:hypothetical protein
VTSSNHTYTDRFGVQHWTVAGIEFTADQAIAAFGYITMDSFQAGATLTLPNQVLRDTSTGEYYRWDGTFPKTVPAGSTPASSGGVGTGAWLSVGDAVLRSQISDPDGAILYPELQMARWRDVGDVRGWGAVLNGINDDTSAINAATLAVYTRGGGQVLIPAGHAMVSSLLLCTPKCILRERGVRLLVLQLLQDLIPGFSNRSI